MYDLIGIDMPCMDLNVIIDEMPKANGGCRIRNLSWQGGGKVSSGLAAAARLGLKCGIMGAVGDDKFGRFCAEDFERHGIDISGLRIREGQTTSLSIVLSDRKTSSRSFVFKPGSADRMEFTPEDKNRVQNARYLFIATLDEAVFAAVRSAREAKVGVVIDADSYSDELLKAIPLVDVFIASEQVYERMFGSFDSVNPDNVKRNCMSVFEKGPGIVVFTFGGRGCAGYSSEGFFYINAFEVPVVDTVGAGDVFHGGFMAALLQGKSAEECARYASAVSAIKITRIGGRAGIPDRATVERFLKDGTIDYTEIDQRVAFYERGIDHV